MRINGGSELARMQMLQRQAIDTRGKLDVASQELTTGLKADRFEATGGNLTRLFALERSLERNAVFTQNISLAELRLGVMQESLGAILAPAEDLAVDLIDAAGKGDQSVATMHAGAARRAFADAVRLLNGQVAGQALFAGTGTDGAALSPSDAMLADLDAMAAGAANATDAIAAIEGYFARPAGAFYTDGYLGSPDDLSPVDIGDGQRLSQGVRADDDRLVAVLKAQAMAAVVAGGAFEGDPASRMTMLGEAGEQMLAAKEGVLDLRAGVGSLQETLEGAKARRVSERATLDLARTGMMATDPLEAASNYQQLQVQLETIYTVTSRLANLRFSNFMR